MGQSYIGEIRMFAGNFQPAGWAFCDGRLIPIDQNDALFNLIGTTYGGDGQTTFALPDLRSRVPVHAGTLSGTTFQLGENAGVETVTLTTSQIPNHTHLPQCDSTNNSSNSPLNSVWAGTSALKQFLVIAPNVAMAPQALSPTGGSQPHDNMIPYLAINFIISLFGVFPSPN
jgi:microcystin-dependent protein